MIINLLYGTVQKRDRLQPREKQAQEIAALLFFNFFL